MREVRFSHLCYEQPRLCANLSYLMSGMFLYARIILDNLEQMPSVDEIWHELKALPIDLKEA